MKNNDQSKKEELLKLTISTFFLDKFESKISLGGAYYLTNLDNWNKFDKEECNKLKF
jgi:hypothetical protein